MFARGALGRLAEEAQRCGIERALVIATPGSGARLGARAIDVLGPRAAGMFAHAAVHVPKAVAESGLEAARAGAPDGLVAVGGGAAIGLAKIIARDLGLPIVAVPTTYSGSEATTIWGLSEGDRKFTGKDARVLPRTIIYDPDLTLTLPPAVTAASGMNAMAHCVESMWVEARTPFLMAVALDAVRRLAKHLPSTVAHGDDFEARAECLVAAWLAGFVLNAGTALQHKLAHVLGGLGLPHAEVHAIILPHVTRFNLAAAPQAREYLALALDGDGAERLALMLACLPIPQRLAQVGFSPARIGAVAAEVAALAITAPRPVAGADVRGLLAAAL
ncbi:MAG: maleylacetate reductase [Xanthobacteraceae bacterium]